MVNVKPRDNLQLGIRLNTGKSGLAMVLKDYQEVAMKHLWTLNGGGASSNDVYKAVNETMPAREHDNGRTASAISRASIINFLNAMVDEGVLNYTTITDRGGPKRIYTAKYNESGFKQWIHFIGFIF